MQPKIYKFVLELTARQEIEMPSHHILTVQKNEDRIAIWAAVLPGSTYLKHVFYMRKTGEELSKEMLTPGSDYIGTVQLRDKGTFHIFKEKRVLSDSEKRSAMITDLKTIFPDKTEEELKADLEAKTGGHGVSLPIGESPLEKNYEAPPVEAESKDVEESDS